MSICIAGAGWVTPLGSGIDLVWNRLLASETAQPDEITEPIAKKSFPVYRVPPDALKGLPPHPRLRRASAISRFAAAAGLAACESAKLTLEGRSVDRLALIFAVANGGVIYTKRFYSDIVNTGADAASPLLFPETVFNAAASHLAAIMNLTGTTYTLVGDGAIGVNALKMAEDIMADDQLDHCLVVAAEEADWLLCDAYQKWRLLRSAPPLELFSPTRKGTILSEGAGAVLLSRSGHFRIEATAVDTFANRKEAPATLARIIRQVGPRPNTVVIGSANGTFIDGAEQSVVDQVLPEAVVYCPKASLGEGVAASGLWQIIAAMQALATQQLPPPQYANGKPSRSQADPLKLEDCTEVTVLSCGLNHQAAAIRIVLNR